MTFEYKVVPAPTRGRKARGVKTPADRFARALEDTINELAADGWEYLRTDTLPAEERQGLTGRTTVYQNMLVFRRAVETAAKGADRAVTVPAPTAAPAATAPAVGDPTPAPARDAEDTPAAPPANSLNTLIEEELAAARAPKLPSAGEAQELADKQASPTLSADRKDLAAE